ncbi:MAG: hypothetical protein ACLUNZ_01090 [Evtepia sp.]
MAASLLNRVTPEQEEALADAGITCRCLVRLPQEDHTAQVAELDGHGSPAGSAPKPLVSTRNAAR